MLINTSFKSVNLQSTILIKPDLLKNTEVFSWIILCKYTFLLSIFVLAVANKMFFLLFGLSRLGSNIVTGGKNFASEATGGTADAVPPKLCLAKTLLPCAGAETFEA